ncbi:glycosyltransferase family A protein [Dysgonomonas sp. 511]|uniref:glycosyltransferase family A protein n=1 Tax=Dysgonomonas sp. 511 TaxID=2302930 RepID=UPI0013D69701|nr:glycosyltransferase family 2 protein [Dysgonomonas sp. 511]NDV78855.1 glycosyltransferase family 2 protein [Dysgonomonas sp. 511]
MIENKMLTVFTPAYNRAHTIWRTYESLCRQTSKDFIWLIIDDGSSDNTKELVDQWIEENKIPIRYIYQENQGMHGAHNTAYQNITTKYNICIDSDDYMPRNAIEEILNEIKPIDDNPTCAGIIGLDAIEDGSIIGTKIPEFLNQVKLNELYQLYKVKGDKKLVYKTDIVNSYPEYPVFKGEKFVPLDYKYLLIDQDYYLKPVNKVFCIVEYLADGSTKNIFRQYKNNPKGFAFSRLSRIKYGLTFIERFKNATHLVSSVIFIKDISYLAKVSNMKLIIASFPFGILLNLYIRLKLKKRK